jgi:hypothetical protein
MSDPIELFSPMQCPSAAPATVPDVACVYFVLRDREIVYIGQTGNLKKRMKDKKHPANLEKGLEIRWMPEVNLSRRLRLEGALILLHMPEKNSAIMLNLRGRKCSEIRWRRKGTGRTR